MMNIRYPIYEGVYRILTIYYTVSSIYRIGKEDGETIRIEHIRQLQLQSKDSTNIFNQSDNGRKRSEE